MSNFVTTLASADVGEHAVTPQPPAEWWYANVRIEAPGTPVHGACLIATFSRFQGAIEEGRFLLVSPDADGPVLSFGSGRQPVGAITASTEELDVRLGASRLAGAYPNYTLRLEGSSDGLPVAADIRYTADVDPDRVSWLDGQLKHFVVYRLDATGTLTLGGETYPVRGVGYYEHAYGTFGWEGPRADGPVPHFASGWNWYWTPAIGTSGAVVQFAGIDVLSSTQPFALVSFTVDGREFRHFAECAVEAVETRDYEGVTYPHRIRVTDSNEHGDLDVVFTRSGVAHQTLLTEPDRPALFFRTGHADIQGTLSWDGTKYELTGPAFGSAFRVLPPR